MIIMRSVRPSVFEFFSREGLILAVLFILLTAGLILLTLYADSEHTLRRNETVLAERLRLLSQQIPKVIYEVERQKSDAPFVRLPRTSRDDLHESITATDDILTAFREGGAISVNGFRPVVISPLRSAESRFALTKIDSIWRAYKPHLVLVWNARDSLSTTELSNMAWAIGDYQADFSHAINALLVEIDHAAHAESFWLRTWQIGCVLISAIMFLLLMLLLLRRSNELQTKLLHLESEQVSSKKLRQTIEADFKTCFEHSTNLIFQIDDERRLLSANRAFCEKLEYRAEELHLLTLDRLIAEDNRAHFLNFLLRTRLHRRNRLNSR